LYLSPTPLPGERGLMTHIMSITTPFSPGRRGQGDEVYDGREGLKSVILMRL